MIISNCKRFNFCVFLDYLKSMDATRLNFMIIESIMKITARTCKCIFVQHPRQQNVLLHLFFSYCSFCSPDFPVEVFSCEMSTKCYTQDTLIKETCLDIESDSCNIQIGNKAIVSMIEFHRIVH